MSKQLCTCCGQIIRKLNPHRMCKQKVAMLEFLAKANDWVFVQHGYGAYVNGEASRVPYRAEAHASRLSWFGLAEHGPVRSGKYRITQKGIDFLRGLAQVPVVIYCKDGVVVDQSTILVGVNGIKDVVLDKSYWDNYGQLQT